MSGQGSGSGPNQDYKIGTENRSREGNSREHAPNSNNILNSSLLDRSRMLDHTEILSQQHLVMHSSNIVDNPQKTLKINQQSVSVNNF